MNEEILNAFNNGATDANKQVALHKSAYEHLEQRMNLLRMAYHTYFYACKEKDKGIKRLQNKIKRLQRSNT